MFKYLNLKGPYNLLLEISVTQIDWIIDVILQLRLYYIVSIFSLKYTLVQKISILSYYFVKQEYNPSTQQFHCIFSIISSYFNNFNLMLAIYLNESSSLSVIFQMNF